MQDSPRLPLQTLSQHGPSMLDFPELSSSSGRAVGAPSATRHRGWNPCGRVWRAVVGQLVTRTRPHELTAGPVAVLTDIPDVFDERTVPGSLLLA